MDFLGRFFWATTTDDEGDLSFFLPRNAAVADHACTAFSSLVELRWRCFCPTRAASLFNACKKGASASCDTKFANSRKAVSLHYSKSAGLKRKAAGNRPRSVERRCRRRQVTSIRKQVFPRTEGANKRTGFACRPLSRPPNLT